MTHEAFANLVDGRHAATFRIALAIHGNEADARTTSGRPTSTWAAVPTTNSTGGRRNGVRIYMLGAGAGRRIWIDVEAGDRLTLEQLVSRAGPVIESFEFSAP